MNRDLHVPNLHVPLLKRFHGIFFYNRIKGVINHNTFKMCGNINWRSQQGREISVTGFKCYLMILSLVIGGKSWTINGYILKCFYLFVAKS